MSLFENTSYSQCSDGSTASTLSYDTVFRGGGNSNYSFNFPQFDTSKTYLHFPQFDPSKGTLVKVEIQTLISVKYTYTLENQDQVPLDYLIKMLRTDSIESGVLMEPLEGVSARTLATHRLQRSNGVPGSGPDYISRGPLYAFKNKPINYTLDQNIAAFLGTGQVDFKYSTETLIAPTGSTYSWDPVTEDSIYFKLVYHYCLTSLLPADIVNFNAVKVTSGKNQHVQLSWVSANDIAGNKYEIEKSNDGTHFTLVKTFIANNTASNNYRLTYVSTNDDKNKVFFRIKQTETDGSLKYSGIKTVALDYTATTMKLYPTLTKDNVNIYFPYSGKGDYQVNIVSLTGQLMQQSEYARTNFIKVNLKAGIKPGLYIVSVVNKQTAETQQSKLVIQ
jgi:hypothetical protein